MGESRASPAKMHGMALDLTGHNQSLSMESHCDSVLHASWYADDVAVDSDGEAPLTKMTVNLLSTYRGINEVQDCFTRMPKAFAFIPYF
jgi:hypothetical protein